jgi:hypothetical protein
MRKFIWQVFIIGLCTGLFAELAAASVGKVIIAKGETYAIDSANNARPLQRRSEVLEGDTLVTGGDSEIHIRFEDNAVLALRADSQLKISEYHAASNGEQEKVLMELLSGGFRTITGAFGKTDKEAYQIKTPNASIGIRGTNYEALLNNQELLVGVYKGGVKLQNSTGVINLGMDSAFSFAQVGGQNQSFQGLMEAPKELSKPLATSFKAPPAENKEAKSEASAEMKAEDDDLLISNLFDDDKKTLEPLNPPKARPDLNTVQALLPPDATLEDIRQLTEGTNLSQFADVRLTQEQIKLLNQGAPVGFVVVNDNQGGYRIPIYTSTYNYIGTTYTPSGVMTFDVILKTEQEEHVYTVELTGLSNISIVGEVSSQLDGSLGGEVNGVDVPALVQVELVNGKLEFKGITDEGGAEIIINNFQGTDAQLVAQEMGLCSTTPECTGDYNLGAPSINSYDRATHFGYVVPSSNGPVFVNYESESIYALNGDYKAPDNVFRGHPDATRTDFTTVDLTNEGTELLRWGYWNTSAANPAVLLKDPKNLDSAEIIEAPYFYVIAPPQQSASLIGQKSLSTVVDWHATSSTSTGHLTTTGTATLAAQLEVDFATAEAYGTIQLQDSSESWTWNVEHYGEVKGAQYFSDWGFGSLVDNGTTYDAVGHVDGLFTAADTGTGFAGGFGFQTTNDLHTAQGVLFIKE